MTGKAPDMDNTKKLGFGLMRLPKKVIGIDIEQTKQMVDMFMQAGFTYFDTAHVYPGSEDAIGKALVERYPRDSFTLATKLFVPTALTANDAKKQLYTSLSRMGTDYVDYYLLHCIMENNYKKYERFGLWDYALQEKEKGTIRHRGFSFHSGPKLLDKLLCEHPEVEFVQLQINYADWERKSVTSRANYEVARKHGKKIVVMEPVKGGALADPPKEIRAMFEEYAPNMSPASWAIRFAASLDGILTVLSGMSNVGQMSDNLSYMKDFKPLNGDEQQIIYTAQSIMSGTQTIPCTACRYCTKGCPQHIPIPDIFAAMNKRIGGGQLEAAQNDYTAIKAKGACASDCVACGQCESVCPQHIAIIDSLKSCSEAFEGAR